MGFEVVYSYHERKEDGSYNMEEIKSLKKKIGEPFEEVDLEKAAGIIMSQLARRDILISKVGVTELVKKEISFKETKGGIVLKNKKFLFDFSGNKITVEDLDIENSSTTTSPPSPPKSNVNLYKKPANSQKNIMVVRYMPAGPQIQEVARTGMKFTEGKLYSVFGTEKGNLGEIYLTKDDSGRDVKISEIYFVPGSINLGDDFQQTSNSRDQSDGLSWPGLIKEDVFDIRKGRRK